MSNDYSSTAQILGFVRFVNENKKKFKIYAAKNLQNI